MLGTGNTPAEFRQRCSRAVLEETDDSPGCLSFHSVPEPLALCLPSERRLAEQGRLERRNSVMFLEDQVERRDRPGEREPSRERPGCRSEILSGTERSRESSRPHLGVPTLVDERDSEAPGSMAEERECTGSSFAEHLEGGDEAILCHGRWLERAREPEWLARGLPAEGSWIVSTGQPVRAQRLRAEALAHASRRKIGELADRRDTERTESFLNTARQRQPCERQWAEEGACLRLGYHDDLARSSESSSDRCDPRCASDADPSRTASACDRSEDRSTVLFLAPVQQSDATSLEPHTVPFWIYLQGRGKRGQEFSERACRWTIDR